MWKALFISISLFLSSAAGATEKSSSFKVLFLGDSLTAGWGVRKEDAHPTVVEKLFRESQLSVEVINGGVDGDTTLGGLRRLEWMFRTEPNLVVVALGGNDMLRALPPEQTKKNLHAILTRLKEKSIPAVLLGMRAAGTMGATYEQQFNAIYPELASEFKVPLMPFYIEKVAGKKELNLPDGIHPTSEGQRIIATEVFKFLKPVVEKELARREG